MTSTNGIYEKDRPEILAGLLNISDVLAVVAAGRRELPRSREARGARRRQVVETTQETLGRSEANESERSPLGGHHSPVI